jgi:hypothetical protein
LQVDGCTTANELGDNGFVTCRTRIGKNEVVREGGERQATRDRITLIERCAW